MAAVSDNKYDVHDWIKSIIHSCQTPQQMISCIKLIRNFNTMYKDQELYESLRWYETHNWHTLQERQLADQQFKEKQLLKG